jgi:enoyl-CoA hydratase
VTDDKHVRVETNGAVSTVVLDKPAVRNAVDRATADALSAAFLAFEWDDTAQGGAARFAAGSGRGGDFSGS